MARDPSSARASGGRAAVSAIRANLSDGSMTSMSKVPTVRVRHPGLCPACALRVGHGNRSTLWAFRAPRGVTATLWRPARGQH